MPSKNKPAQRVSNLLRALTGKTAAGDQYVGKTVYGRAGTAFADSAGVVTNTSACRLDGCGGTRLHVKWPDGHRTYPCAKGCVVRENGDLEIR